MPPVCKSITSRCRVPAKEVAMEDHQILAWLISLVGFGVPLGKIFHRAGFSAWWGHLGLLSFLGMLIAWIVLAMRDWRWRGAV